MPLGGRIRDYFYFLYTFLCFLSSLQGATYLLSVGGMDLPRAEPLSLLYFPQGVQLSDAHEKE